MDTQKGWESHPDSGRFAQKYADAQGALVVVNGRATGQVESENVP